ncbi:MAG: hypothetical protein MPN21_26200 [Thermoanaerobaculia bacterium]|nr:hypothetical protein [Thermoanaerobaculia bacterium]
MSPLSRQFIRRSERAFGIAVLAALGLPIPSTAQTCEQLPLPSGVQLFVEIEAVYHGPPEIALPASLGSPSSDLFDEVFGVLVYKGEAEIEPFSTVAASPIPLSIAGSDLALDSGVCRRSPRPSSLSLGFVCRRWCRLR